MPKQDPALLQQVTVSLPFEIDPVSWELDPTEKKAAWKLYIERLLVYALQAFS
jgi:hypothetical protein